MLADILAWIAGRVADLVQVYPSLRPAFFGGLVSLAGFLFSIYGYTIIRMKESVYDTDTYDALVRERLINNPKLEHYGPLNRLSHLLFLTIVTALISAVCQITVGLADTYRAAVFVCYLMVLVTVSMVGFSLFTVWRNLSAWFEELEKAKAKARSESGG